MVSEGVLVINYSVGGAFDGPGDGTSPYSDSQLKAVDRVVNGGTVWVNSAGNSARNTWFKPRPRTDANAFVIFNRADNRNDVPLRAGDTILSNCVGMMVGVEQGATSTSISRTRPPGDSLREAKTLSWGGPDTTRLNYWHSRLPVAANIRSW